VLAKANGQEVYNGTVGDTNGGYATSSLGYRQGPSASPEYYAIRIYNRTLSEIEQARNHFADLAKWFRLDLTPLALLVGDELAPIYAAVKDFTLQSLQALYESGKHMLVLECLRRFSGGHLRWVRNELRFLIDPANGHLCMTVVLVDIHEQKEKELKTIERAEHDPLTGLLNRESFHKMVEQTPGIKEKTNAMHALMIIDLDDFKHINDTWGHQAGDHCLQVCAKTLRDSFRVSDLVVRLGGDEFIVFMRFITNREAAEANANALLEAIHQAPLGYEGAALNVSIGIGLYPSDGEDIDTLYARADKALYQAKHLGKNKACFADELNLSGGGLRF
jgi:diguanylate cyclase (GGDEF)-like protein